MTGLFTVPFQYIPESVNPPVPEERPSTPYILCPVKVYVDHFHPFLVLAELGKDLTLRAGSEGMAPELQARSIARRVVLMPCPVHCDDRQPVCHGMAPLHQLPGTALELLLLFRVGPDTSDGRRIYQYLRLQMSLSA